MTDPREASRPTRLLIIVTVFLVGAYPPVLWATWIALTLLPPVALVPLASLAGMTLALIRLWKPMPSGWAGAAVLFLIGWMISVATLGTSFGRLDRISVLDASAVAYFTLALAAMLVMKERWSAWAEESRRSPPGE